MFQPKLILAQKSSKLTPRPDPPEVGTRQLTLCPLSTNSLEPSPKLVPSEVPTSGHHGFVKWGHDAKITKIGTIVTHGSPGHRIGGGTSDLYLSVQFGIRSKILMGKEIWGRQLTTRGGGEIGVPKGGLFGYSK